MVSKFAEFQSISDLSVFLQVLGPSSRIKIDSGNNLRNRKKAHKKEEDIKGMNRKTIWVQR